MGNTKTSVVLQNSINSTIEFNEYLTDTTQDQTSKTSIKEKTKKTSRRKTLVGELELETGGKMLPLGQDDYALDKLMSVNDAGDLKPEIGDIRKHIKSNWGINKISDISKDLNGSLHQVVIQVVKTERTLIAVAVKKESGRSFVETPEWEEYQSTGGDWGDSAIKLGKSSSKNLRLMT